MARWRNDEMDLKIRAKVIRYYRSTEISICCRTYSVDYTSVPRGQLKDGGLFSCVAAWISKKLCARIKCQARLLAGNLLAWRVRLHKWLIITLKPIKNCFVSENCVVKCLHGNVTFVTAKQLPVGSVFLRKSPKMYVNTSTSKKLKVRVTYVLRVDEIYKIIWFYQLSWQCKLATVKRFESWRFER